MAEAHWRGDDMDIVAERMKPYNPDADTKDTRRLVSRATGSDEFWAKMTRLPNEAERAYLLLMEAGGGHAVLDVQREMIMNITQAQWARTRGVYRFDPTLAAAVDDTPVEGLTDDVLTRLPEWSVYIKVERANASRYLHGGFVTYIPDPNGLTGTVMFLVITASDIPAQPFYYIPSLIRVRLGAPVSFGQRIKAGDAADHSRTEINPHEAVLMSRAAYLCSQEPDIRNPKAPKVQPVRKKSNEPVRQWEVGYRFGKAFRAALEEGESVAGHGAENRQRPRVHVRRAHWHTVLSGPRDRQRQREVRWFPPQIINAEGDEMPTVIWRQK